MKTDIPKLRVKMFEKGETIKSMAKKLEVNRDTFGRWLKQDGLTIDILTVHKIAEILELSGTDILDMFFIEREGDCDKYII
ncbi:helix-turn-helix transcriptional regulator [Emergencia timonensis]|uniref:helix-turn-helix domain-containing protein n=1 Tax=Emergencia timonensis TaxID=1776384 RepID=UPI001D0875B6|nr:helix-turn-helix transcriptional regulator [Emergencia timonensis]MCB6475561.1 helix-turn-helix transcriptional regulator [Emergencia timonensis]